MFRITVQLLASGNNLKLTSDFLSNKKLKDKWSQPTAYLDITTKWQIAAPPAPLPLPRSLSSLDNPPTLREPPSCEKRDEWILFKCPILFKTLNVFHLFSNDKIPTPLKIKLLKLRLYYVYQCLRMSCLFELKYYTPLNLNGHEHNSKQIPQRMLDFTLSHIGKTDRLDSL